MKDQRLGKYPVRVRLAGYEDWDGALEVPRLPASRLPRSRQPGTED